MNGALAAVWRDTLLDSRRPVVGGDGPHAMARAGREAFSRRLTDRGVLPRALPLLECSPGAEAQAARRSVTNDPPGFVDGERGQPLLTVAPRTILTFSKATNVLEQVLGAAARAGRRALS